MSFFDLIGAMASRSWHLPVKEEDGMRRLVLTLGIFIAVVTVTNAGTFLKCKDRDGNMLFTDNPPPDAVCEGLKGYTPSRDVPAPKPADRETNRNEKTPPVVELFVTSWCPWSVKAQEFFRAKGIAFSAYDIEQDPDAQRRKDDIDPEKGVPTVVINGKVINGYNPQAYNRALEERR